MTDPYRGNEPAGGQAARRITRSLLFSAFILGFVNTISGLLVNDVIAEYALVGAAQGLLSSMLSVGLVLALFINPLFQGRVSKLTVLLVSCLLQVGALVLSGAAQTFPVFLVSLVLLGVGVGWLDSYMNSGIVDVHPADSQKYLGYLHGVSGVGMLLGPLLIQWILMRASWRASNFVIAGLMLLAALYAGFVRITAGRAGAASMQETRLTASQVGQFLKSKRSLLLLGCGCAISVVQNGVICWIARYMFLSYNAAALGAACLSIYWVTATLNRFLTPRLRVQPLLLVLIGSVLSALFLSAGVYSGSAVIMCVAVGLTGLSSGHFLPVMVAECAAGYRGNTTLTTTLMMLVFNVARIFLPLVMAALTESVSPNLGMSVPIFGAAASAVLSLLAMRTERAAARA